ncbi:MAG: TonB-dependent receptor [Rikenellaceae bacterium]
MGKIYLKLSVVVTLLSALWLFASTPLMAQSGGYTVAGEVTDMNGEPIISASVVADDGITYALSDADGKFTIKLKPGSKSVTVSFMGYRDQEVSVSGKSLLKVILMEDTNNIEEIQVVGYGVQKKATMTGAVASVGTEELLKSTSSSVANALAGMMPGVTTTLSTGQPGAEVADIYIRGTGSLSTDKSTPLVLVDGVERDFSQLDPNEIESLSILKDASATAVFGVRGANGVIIVTTRRGQEGKARIDFSSSVSLQSPTRLVEMADSYTTASMRNELYTNDGGDIANAPFSEYTLNMFATGEDPIMYPDIDWRDYLMNDSSLQTQHNVNISGGTDKVRYFTSIGYLFQEGIMSDIGDLSYDSNYKYNRYNFRTNLDIDFTESTSMKLNIGGRVGDVYSPNSGSSERNMWEQFTWALPYSSPGIIDGVKMTTSSDVFGVMANAIDFYGLGYTTVTSNDLNLDLELNQKLDFVTKGLSFNIKGAYNADYTVTREWDYTMEVWTPYYAGMLDGLGLDITDDDYDKTIVYKITGETDSPSFSESDSMGRDWYAETSLRYARTFDKHDVSALALYTQSKTYYPSTYESIPSGYVGLVGRVTYNYDRKYLAEFNVGYNGSENFAPDLRYGLFPAGSAGWVVSEEKFMKSQNVIDYLKFRASYGLVGNDNLGSNRFLYLADGWEYTTGAYNFGTTSSSYYGGAEATKMGNYDVTWETAAKQNYGVEMTFLKSKLSITADYFFEHRENILISRNTVPIITGLNSSSLPAVNMGIVDNQGYEISLKWNDNIGEFAYWVQANLSYAHNTIIEMDETAKNEPYMYQTGKSVGQAYGYTALGLYQESDFADSENGVLLDGYPTPLVGDGVVRPGDVMYEDKNEDGVIDSDDMSYIGYSTVPEYVGGLLFGFSYKGFSVSTQWTAATNVSQVLGDSYKTPFSSSGTRGLLQYLVDDRWTPETAETATLPRLTMLAYNNNCGVNSTLWTKDASYLRLKNVEVAYTFRNNPTFDKLGISKLRVYFSGYNLWTLDYIGFLDPESPSSNANDVYPINRLTSLGINLSF